MATKTKKTPSSTRNIALAEKNQKISEAMREFHAERKRKEELAIQIEKDLSKKFASISNTRDALRYSFVNLNPASIRSVLDSTQTGYLQTWSDFCDYILEMDPHIKGLTNVRTHTISGKKLIIEPGDNSEEAKAAASFVQDAISNIPEFDKLTRQLLMATFKGVSTAEIIYKRNEIKNCYDIKEIVPISMKRIKIRLNPVMDNGDRFQTPVDTGYGRWVYSYYNYGENSYGEGLDFQEMFPGKFIVHSPGDEEIPHYRGLFRSLAFSWFFKQTGLAFWASGAEKYAFPAMYAKVPRSTPDSSRINLAQNLNNLANDASAVVDNDVEIETINPGATGGDSVWKQFLGYLNAEMTKLLLGGTLSVEASSTGANRALGEVHERVREDLMLSDANALSETLKIQLVKPLLEYNLHLFGGKMPKLPNMYFDVTTRNYEPISQMHIDAGVVTKNELRESAGLVPWSNELGGNDVILPPTTQTTSTDNATFSITNGNSFNNASTAYAETVSKQDEEDSVAAASKNKLEPVTDLEIIEMYSDTDLDGSLDV